MLPTSAWPRTFPSRQRRRRGHGRGLAGTYCKPCPHQFLDYYVNWGGISANGSAAGLVARTRHALAFIASPARIAANIAKPAVPRRSEAD